MSDGLPDTDLVQEVAESKRGLTYPFGAPPGPGEAIEVADGVLWMRLPLPFALDHINVWALRDKEGWTLVDTGVNSSPTRAAWEAAFAGPLRGLPVTRLIVTHMHPDHVGLAGWLTERFGCRLWMTRLEYTTCRMLLGDTGRPAPEAGVAFCRAAGWSEAQVEGYRQRFGFFGRGVHPLPDAFRRIEEGEVFEVDGRTWRVVGGNGHSPEHACLYRADDGVLISGDQLLPKISSNVSVWPTEPDADPMSDWLASLIKLRAELPADTLVLPSHGEPFYGLHTRSEALERGHEKSLTRLHRLLARPSRAVDVFGALFARPIGDDVIGMATGESLAHLNCLLARGLAVSETRDDGVVWWRAA